MLSTLNGLLGWLVRQSDGMVTISDLMETGRRTGGAPGNVDVGRSRGRWRLVTQHIDLVVVRVHCRVTARPWFPAAAQGKIHRPFCNNNFINGNRDRYNRIFLPLLSFLYNFLRRRRCVLLLGEKLIFSFLAKMCRVIESGNEGYMEKN